MNTKGVVNVEVARMLAARGHSRRGLLYMLLAGVLFAVMANCAYAAALTHPPVAAAMVSFIRVAVNLLLLLIPAIWSSDVRGLFGDFRPSLWLRGLFGGGALFFSFASIQRIGPGKAVFSLPAAACWSRL
jgi:S-adenosylmethionine uptake transporter